MGDMYSYDDTNTNNHNHNHNHNHNPCASSSSVPQDEISLFLRQILLRSSSASASSPSLTTHTARNAHDSMSFTSMAGLCSSDAGLRNARPSDRSSLFRDGISAVDSSAGVSASNDAFLSSSGTYCSASKGSSVVNVSSLSFGVSENEIDEGDCESEEGIEALVEEQPAKSAPPRSSSKRSRAAEVHNLSEKRRRSRINEKMKALQNLIPNSNKTDKASMLDEAIEYLKQLQLQVQMLSMRNGLSLHPMCFSEGLQAQALQLPHMRAEINEENRSLPLNMTSALPLHQENPLQYVSFSSRPNKRNAQDHMVVPSPSYITNPETSFGLESPMLTPLRPFEFQPKRTSQMRRDDISPHSDTNPLVSLSFDMPRSEQRDKSSLETCIAGRDQSGVILRNSENNVILTSQLSR